MGASSRFFCVAYHNLCQLYLKRVKRTSNERVAPVLQSRNRDESVVSKKKKDQRLLQRKRNADQVAATHSFCQLKKELDETFS